jgi:uncharacterized protein YlaI
MGNGRKKSEYVRRCYDENGCGAYFKTKGKYAYRCPDCKSKIDKEARSRSKAKSRIYPTTMIKQLKKRAGVV